MKVKDNVKGGNINPDFESIAILFEAKDKRKEGKWKFKMPSKYKHNYPNTTIIADWMFNNEELKQLLEAYANSKNPETRKRFWEIIEEIKKKYNPKQKTIFDFPRKIISFFEQIVKIKIKTKPVEDSWLESYLEDRKQMENNEAKT